MNDKGETVEVIREPTPDVYLDSVKVLKEMVDRLDSIAGETCPVGMGTPGAWVPERKVMKNCNSTVLNNKPFLLDLKRLLNRPIRIANDANCMVLSEAVDGAGAHGRSVFGVIIGTGVGGGWVVDKKLIDGPNLLAGEWGHNPFPQIPSDIDLSFNPNKQSRKCYCGRENCVETFLSGRGLEMTHESLHGVAMPSPKIGMGETKEAQATVDEYIKHLALALSVIVNVLDPDVIVLAGGLSNIKMIYNKLPALLQKHSFSSEGLTDIKQARYGDSSGRRGAAWLFPATD